MRVIAGSSRGRKLTEFQGHNVRPTPDRVREALFSILTSRLGRFSGLQVLDLFAGSGALAIEALSRGAASACLVDKDPSSVRIIKENLARCHYSEQTSLLTSEADKVIRTFSADSFDLIFLDPPYNMGLAEATIAEIANQRLLRTEGILCAETGSAESLPESIGNLQRIDQRRYGSTMIHFYAVMAQATATQTQCPASLFAPDESV